MDAISRVLRLSDRGKRLEIPIRVSWPVDEGSAWSCRWEIQWPGQTRSNAARGVDAIEALIHALQMIGAELYCSEMHKSGRLSWTEGWVGYGFPVSPIIRDLLVGDDKHSL